jgi:hypothetical protein
MSSRSTGTSCCSFPIGVMIVAADSWMRLCTVAHDEPSTRAIKPLLPCAAISPSSAAKTRRSK